LPFARLQGARVRNGSAENSFYPHGCSGSLPRHNDDCKAALALKRRLSQRASSYGLKTSFPPSKFPPLCDSQRRDIPMAGSNIHRIGSQGKSSQERVITTSNKKTGDLLRCIPLAPVYSRGSEVTREIGQSFVKPRCFLRRRKVGSPRQSVAPLTIKFAEFFSEKKSRRAGKKK